MTRASASGPTGTRSGGDALDVHYLNAAMTIDGQLDQLQISTDAPNFVRVTGAGLSITYPRSYLGTIQTVTVSVADGDATLEQLMEVHVTDDIIPIVSEPLPDLTLMEGEFRTAVFDLDDHFYDGDPNDELTFSHGDSSLEITIHDDGTVDILANVDTALVEELRFFAADTVGAQTDDLITVTVVNVNDPPQFDPINPLIIHYDEPYRFDLGGYLRDPDDEISTLEITTSDPEHVTVDLNGDSDPQPELVFHYPISFRNKKVSVIVSASDGAASASRTIEVSVSAHYPPQQRESLPTLFILEDTPVTAALDLSDYFIVDGQAHYTVAGEGAKHCTISIDATGRVDLEPESNWSGIETVRVKVTDQANAYVEASLRIIVQAVNDPPQFSTPPTIEVERGALTIYDLGPYIFDTDTAAHELNITSSSSFVRFNGLLAIFEYPTGNDDGTDTVMITIHDADQNATGALELRLNATAAVAPASPATSGSAISWLLLILVSLAAGLVAFFAFLRAYRGDYKVTEVLLVHRDGILISHVHQSCTDYTMDADLVSGMLTAVQDFIRDSFTTDDPGTDTDDSQWEMKKLEFGGKNIMLERSGLLNLVAIYSGRVGWRLERKMKTTMELIYDRFRDTIENWSGHVGAFQDIEGYLELLLSAAPEEDTSDLEP